MVLSKSNTARQPATIQIFREGLLNETKIAKAINTHNSILTIWVYAVLFIPSKLESVGVLLKRAGISGKIKPATMAAHIHSAAATTNHIALRFFINIFIQLPF